jgi:16S rRNA G1207 methylase RsmC
VTRAFWEDFYGRERRWSGKPNASLVEEVAELEPGTALDLGCGEGGDAIWLASAGWTVTGADISQTALDVAARHAAEAGVTVAWERHDLAESMPAGPFDLVTTSFLHSKVELPRARILRAATEAVASGGTLLVVGHAPSAEHHHVDLPDLDEVIAELALPEDGWQVVTSGLRERGSSVDTVVRFRRR